MSKYTSVIASINQFNNVSQSLEARVCELKKSLKKVCVLSSIMVLIGGGLVVKDVYETT